MYHSNNLHFAAIAAYQETSQIPAPGTVVTNQNMPAGTVAVVDSANKVLTSLPASGKFKVVQSRGANEELVMGPLLDVANTTISSAAYKAPTEQISYIGYNGSTGNVVAENDTSFYIFLEKEDNDEENRTNQASNIAAQFKTSASSSVAEWAHKAAQALFVNTQLEVQADNPSVPRYVHVEVISDGTPTNEIPTATATHGSKAVTLSATGTASAGDIITIAGDTYTIAEKSGTAVTLNNPYRGESDSGLALAIITSPTAYGIKITGVARKYDVLRDRMYYKNRFNVSVGTDGDTAGIPIIQGQGASEGTGAWQQVAQKEFMSYGFAGDNMALVNTPPGNRPQDVVKGGEYSLIQIVTETPAKTMLTSGQFRQVTYVFLELSDGSALADGSQGDILATALVSGFSAGDLDAQ